MASYYQVKRIEYLERNISILTQSENGPCPLLAICNSLILKNKLFINPDYGAVQSDELITMVVEYLLEFEKNILNDPNWNFRINEAISLLPKLSVGLDVNVKFLGFDQFEFTVECDIFDIAEIRLVHGWVVEKPEEIDALKNFNYNQAVDFMVSNTLNEKSLLIQKFINENPSQITKTGLKMIENGLNEGEVAVLFRNNHFSTIFKYSGKVYALATDVGFIEVDEVVWECLDNIDGNNHYCNSYFFPLDEMRNSMYETFKVKREVSSGFDSELRKSDVVKFEKNLNQGVVLNKEKVNNIADPGNTIEGNNEDKEEKNNDKGVKKKKQSIQNDLNLQDSNAIKEKLENHIAGKNDEKPNEGKINNSEKDVDSKKSIKKNSCCSVY